MKYIPIFTGINRTFGRSEIIAAGLGGRFPPKTIDRGFAAVRPFRISPPHCSLASTTPGCVQHSRCLQLSKALSVSPISLHPHVESRQSSSHFSIHSSAPLPFSQPYRTTRAPTIRRSDEVAALLQGKARRQVEDTADKSNMERCHEILLEDRHQTTSSMAPEASTTCMSCTPSVPSHTVNSHVHHR